MPYSDDYLYISQIGLAAKVYECEFTYGNIPQERKLVKYKV